MLHPPGPSKLYPEANKALEDLLADVEDEEERRMMEAIEAVIETPPEWGRPDEGNPNQPRRPPEYQPPQVGRSCIMTAESCLVPSICYICLAHMHCCMQVHSISCFEAVIGSTQFTSNFFAGKKLKSSAIDRVLLE